MTRVVARSSRHVIAEQWTDWDVPLPDICFEERHRSSPRKRKPGRVKVCTPHVHLTSDRSLSGPFDFIDVGDWILRDMSGQILGVMSDEAFRDAYEVVPAGKEAT